MNIIYYHWRSDDPITESISTFVSNEIKNGLDCESRGIAEEANAKANRAAEAIGHLCDILATKGVLRVDEVTEIAGSYHELDKKRPKLSP